MNQTKVMSGKAIANNFLINIIGLLLPLIVGIICIPFAIKGLGVQPYGLLTIIWVILGHITLLDFGISKSIIKYISERSIQEDNILLNKIFWTSIITSVFIGIMLILLLWISLSFQLFNILKIESTLKYEFIQLIPYIAIVVPFILITSGLKGFLEAHRRFDIVNLIQIPITILSMIIPALTYLLFWKLKTVIALLVIIKILGSVIYFTSCIKIFPHLINPLWYLH